MFPLENKAHSFFSGKKFVNNKNRKVSEKIEMAEEFKLMNAALMRKYQSVLGKMFIDVQETMPGGRQVKFHKIMQNLKKKKFYRWIFFSCKECQQTTKRSQWKWMNRLLNQLKDGLKSSEDQSRTMSFNAVR
jgi:hypothetical protein